MDTSSYSSFYLAIAIVIVLYIIVDLTIRLIKKKKYTDLFPIVTVDAVVVSKRWRVEVIQPDPWLYRMRINSGQRGIKVPVYYITFAEPNGEQMELAVGENEYKVFNEQDIGKLTYQGKLFKRFEKRREE